MCICVCYEILYSTFHTTCGLAAASSGKLYTPMNIPYKSLNVSYNLSGFLLVLQSHNYVSLFIQTTPLISEILLELEHVARITTLNLEYTSNIKMSLYL